MPRKVQAQSTVTPAATPSPEVTYIWPVPTGTGVTLGDCDPNLTPDPSVYDAYYRWYCGHCFPTGTSSFASSTPWPTSSHATSTPAITGTPPTPVQTTAPTASPTVQTSPSYYIGPPVEITVIGKSYEETLCGLGTHEVEVYFQLPNTDRLVGSIIDFNVENRWVNQAVAAGVRTSEIWGGWLFHRRLCGAEPLLGTVVMAFDALVYPNTPYQTVRDQLAAQYPELMPVLGNCSTIPVQAFFNDSSTGFTGSSVGAGLYMVADKCASIETKTMRVWPIYHGYELAPTPTLGPGVCSSGGDHELGDPDEGILPRIWLRPGECVTVIPALTDVQEIFDTLGIDQPDWLADWTGVQLCFTYVGMSNMNLFGISFNPIYFMLALVAIGLLRNYLLR